MIELKNDEAKNGKICPFHKFCTFNAFRAVFCQSFAPYIHAEKAAI